MRLAASGARCFEQAVQIHFTGSALQVAPLTPGEVADLVDSGSSQGGGQGRHWVLDPIDGTRGFVGMRQYAVCLGLLQEGEVGGSGVPGGKPRLGLGLARSLPGSRVRDLPYRS